MDRCGRRAGFHRSLDRGDIFVGRSLDPGAVQAEHGLHGYGRAGGMVLICFGQMAHVDTSTNAASIFNKRRNTEQERLAQYFTPPQVADFLADLLNIKLDEMVIDPACGEADLLLAANRQVRQNHGTAADIYGIDISHEVVEVGVNASLKSACLRSVSQKVTRLEGKWCLACQQTGIRDTISRWCRSIPWCYWQRSYAGGLSSYVRTSARSVQIWRNIDGC